MQTNDLAFADLADDTDDDAYCPDYIEAALWEEFERDNAAFAAALEAPAITLDSVYVPHVSECIRNYAIAYCAVMIPTLYALELFLRYVR